MRFWPAHSVWLFSKTTWNIAVKFDHLKSSCLFLFPQVANQREGRRLFITAPALWRSLTHLKARIYLVGTSRTHPWLSVRHTQIHGGRGIAIQQERDSPHDNTHFHFHCQVSFLRVYTGYPVQRGYVIKASLTCRFFHSTFDSFRVQIFWNYEMCAKAAPAPVPVAWF